MVQNENDYDNYKNYIDIYDKLYPNKRRPRTLVILTDQDYDSDGSIKNLLQYGWTKKFLDVSLVEERHHCILQEYNPFIDTLTRHNLDSLASKLFPDKLINVHGYKISIGVVTQDTLVTIIRDDGGQAIDLKSPSYDETKIIMNYMNFSIDSIVEINAPGDYANGLKRMVKKLQNSELNNMVVSRGYVIYPNITYVFTEEDCSSINALVPFQTIVQVHLPFHIIIYLLTVILLVSFVTWISRLLRLFGNKLNSVKVLGAFFGIPVIIRPSQASEVMILTSIFLLSIIYPTNFYSSFVKDKLLESPVTYNTYQAIYQSGLPVFIYVNFVKFMMEVDDPFAKKILQKSIANKLSDECVKSLLSGDARICISSYETLVSLLQLYFTNASHHVTFSNQEISCVPKSYLFEKASPYGRKFYIILRKLREFGIDQFIKARHANTTFFLDESESDEMKRSEFSLQLIFLVACGNVSAVLVLIFEYLFETEKQKKLNRIMSQISMSL
uniref:Ionotropic glutamate receptor C-terminal domain-containing protein n=1 Tax=Trichogramma kaykai TaxID=54128 RepID=A0ABD2VSN5_9HYME